MSTVSALFELNPAAANYGKLVVTTTVVDGDSVEASVLGPDTVNYPLTLTAGVASVGFDSWVGLLDLIEDVDGNFVQGDYVVSVIVEEGEGDEENFAETFCLDTDQSKDLNITTVVDCYAKAVVVTDETVYPTGSTQSRSIRVVHPVLTVVDDEADSTTTATQLIVSMIRDNDIAYDNMTYTATVTSINTITEVVNENGKAISFLIRYAMTAFREEIKVMCNLDACGIISCVDTKIQEIAAKACKRGGMGALSQVDKDTISFLQLYLAMYNYAIQCKDYDKINFYYDELKKVIGDCDCECTDTLTAIADNGIIYLKGDTGAAGASGIEWSEWVDVPDDAFNANHQQGSTPLRYRVGPTHMEMLGSFTKSPSGAVVGNPFNMLDVFIPDNADGDPVYPDQLGKFLLYNGSHDLVGTMYRSSVDGEWKVRYITGFNNSALTFVFGQVPLV